MRHPLRSAVLVAIAAGVGLSPPVSAQTMLDKLVARVMKPRTAPAVADPQAPTSARAARHLPVTGFDVAGIRLRASPAEVRAAMAKSGYRISYTGSAQTFSQQVTAEAARRRGTRSPDEKDAGTNNVIATGPHQEALIVHFMQAAAGSEVSNVSLRVPEEAITGDALRRQLLDKYGQPDSTRSGGFELAWCSPEAAANCGLNYAASGPLGNQYPLLSAGVNAYGGGGSLTLEIGETAFPRLAAEKEAAVLRLVPRTDRAAF